jgi:hypothetical protein
MRRGDKPPHRKSRRGIRPAAQRLEPGGFANPYNIVEPRLRSTASMDIGWRWVVAIVIALGVALLVYGAFTR